MQIQDLEEHNIYGVVNEIHDNSETKIEPEFHGFGKRELKKI
jgi:hypothetical protein